jgi:hypothetical protein
VTLAKNLNLFVFIFSCLVFLTFLADNSLAGPKKPFTIILLPDTQKYKHEDRGSRSHIFESQTKWIVDHVIDKNIALVLHLGDIVDYSNPAQWHYASKNLNILNGIVPYVLAVGNHDVSGLDGTKNTRLFNEHFKTNGFNQLTAGPPDLTSLRGVFEENHLENSYFRFNFQGDDYIVISLLYCPSDQMLGWANNIVATHPESKVIVITHSYLGNNNQHVKVGDKQNLSNCENFWPKQKGNEGQQIWEKLISKHSNMQFVLSGHLLPRRLVSKGLNGNMVFEVTTNYQNLEHGGNGFLRLLKFFPDGKRVLVQTYSPFLDEYLKDDQNFFEIDLENGRFLSVDQSIAD